MRLSTSALRTYVLMAVAATTCHHLLQPRFASAQSSCIKSNIEMLLGEVERPTDISSDSKPVTYVYCPGTSIVIGAPVASFGGALEAPFLAFNPKTRFLCGESGERSNDCTVSTLSTNRMPMVYASVFSESGISENWPDPETVPQRPDLDPVDVEFHGFTFDGNGAGSGGALFVASGSYAGVTFKDCEFKDGDGTQGLFIMTSLGDDDDEGTSAPTTKAPTKSPVVSTNSPTTAPVVSTNSPTTAPVVVTDLPTAAPVVPTESPTAEPIVTDPPTISLPPTGSPTYAPFQYGSGRCNPDVPCVISLYPCCSRDGFCGNTSAYCSSGTCISGCDGKLVVKGNGTDTTETTTTKPPGKGGRKRFLSSFHGDVGNSASSVSVESFGGFGWGSIGGSRHRRRAQGDGDTAVQNSRYTFEKCDIRDNIVSPKDRFGAIMVTASVDLTLAECNFERNSFYIGGAENGTVTTIVAGVGSVLDISLSCFTDNESVTSVASMFQTAASSVSTVDSHAASNSFLSSELVENCNGIGVVTGTKSVDPTSWSTVKCDAFTLSTCPLEVVETTTTGAAVSQSGTTPEPSMEPTMANAGSGPASSQGNDSSSGTTASAFFSMMSISAFGLLVFFLA